MYPSSLHHLLINASGSKCTFQGGDNKTVDGTYPDGFYKHHDCGTIKKGANVISVSYTGDESLISTAYQQRECLEHAKLGLAGITMLVATGDCGGL